MGLRNAVSALLVLLFRPKHLLDENPNPTRQQVRDWFTKHHNVCRCNGYIPYVDGVMDAAAVLRGEKKMADITFQMPKDGKIWGSKYPRPSAIPKVTGTLDYGGDLGLKMPSDTLQLALVQAKVSHANILGIDTSEAEKMPGVCQRSSPIKMSKARTASPV